MLSWKVAHQHVMAVRGVPIWEARQLLAQACATGRVRTEYRLTVTYDPWTRAPTPQHRLAGYFARDVLEEFPPIPPAGGEPGPPARVEPSPKASDKLRPIAEEGLRFVESGEANSVNAAAGRLVDKAKGIGAVRPRTTYESAQSRIGKEIRKLQRVGLSKRTNG